MCVRKYGARALCFRHGDSRAVLTRRPASAVLARGGPLRSVVYVVWSCTILRGITSRLWSDRYSDGVT